MSCDGRSVEEVVFVWSVRGLRSGLEWRVEESIASYLGRGRGGGNVEEYFER